MKFHLENIRQHDAPWSESLEFDLRDLDRDELLQLSPIQFAGTIQFVEPNYVLSARIRYRQTLQCPRCLEPTEVLVDAPVDYVIVQGKKSEHEGEIELDEEELGIVRISGVELDTEPLCIEQVQLQLPMKSLCREDCLGLCARCGVNRNLESCQCVQVDARWAGLEGLRSRFVDP